MINRKGFTLIELMVVIFIVGILAAVAIPIMRGRIDAAKWSEGKASMGSIRTAIRALIAEKGNAWFSTNNVDDDQQALGFATTDLDGKYFKHGDFTFSITYTSDTTEPTYTITCTANATTSADAPSTPPSMTLDETGAFSDGT
jgi:type IV pilus assembly protein PilA